MITHTGRSTLIEDMIRSYEHVILLTIKNLETHDSWFLHCNMLILDRGRRKRRGKGQENAQI